MAQVKRIKGHSQEGDAVLIQGDRKTLVVAHNGTDYSIMERDPLHLGEYRDIARPMDYEDAVSFARQLAG